MEFNIYQLLLLFTKFDKSGIPINILRMLLNNIIHFQSNVKEKRIFYRKRKFKQWWYSIPPISTKQTTISHL